MRRVGLPGWCVCGAPWRERERERRRRRPPVARGFAYMGGSGAPLALAGSVFVDI